NMLRNGGSRLAKWVFATFLTGKSESIFQSYRMVLGEIGRSVAAYAGFGGLSRRRHGLGGRPRRGLPGATTRRGGPAVGLLRSGAAIAFRPPRDVQRHPGPTPGRR